MVQGHHPAVVFTRVYTNPWSSRHRHRRASYSPARHTPWTAGKRTWYVSYFSSQLISAWIYTTTPPPPPPLFPALSVLGKSMSDQRTYYVRELSMCVCTYPCVHMYMRVFVCVSSVIGDTTVLQHGQTRQRHHQDVPAVQAVLCLLHRCPWTGK